MDYFTANQTMSLSDARLILDYEIARGTFHGVDSLNDCYDTLFSHNEHGYYNEYCALSVKYSCDVDYTDHDRILDADYIRQLGAWTVALHVVNRALPATDQHCFLCADWFRYEVMKGYADAACADGKTMQEIQHGWRVLLGAEELDPYAGEEQDDYDYGEPEQLELPFELHKWLDWQDTVNQRFAVDDEWDDVTYDWLISQGQLAMGLRNVADYVLALVLWQCGYDNHGLGYSRTEVADDPTFQQRFRYWSTLDHDEVIYAMGNATTSDTDSYDA